MEESTAVATLSQPLPPEVAEKVALGGDLAGLNAAQRAEYYHAVCRSLGLNPLTRPFEYLTLNGKLRLYALRDCADQLRRLHGISIAIANRERLSDLRDKRPSRLFPNLRRRSIPQRPIRSTPWSRWRRPAASTSVVLGITCGS